MAVAGPQTFPLVALPLPELLKKGNQVKTAAAAVVNWMMKPTNTKLGRDKFLFWWHPIEKSFFIESAPLGRFDLVVAMSVCVYVCPHPMRFFSRPLIGPQVT